MPIKNPKPKAKSTFKPGIQNLTAAQRRELGGQYYDGSRLSANAAKLKNLQMAIKDTQKRYNFEKKQKGFPASGNTYYTQRLSSLNSQLKKLKSSM